MPPKLPSAFASSIVRAPSQLPRHRISSPWTCSTCQTLSVLPPNNPRRRAFTTTDPLHKKSSSSNNNNKRTSISPTTTTTSNTTKNDNPLDFSAFETEIQRVLDALKHDLSRIRAGGLDVEKVENVRVKLGGGGGGGGGGGRGKEGGRGGKGKEVVVTVRVGEVAQVVQRGRVMVVMVGEAEHIKPLTTALTTALSITPLPLPSPSPSPQSPTSPTPLEIHIPIPPTTADSRSLAQKAAQSRGETALATLREARGAQKRKLRAMALKKVVGPDEMFRAERELEKVNERGVGEVRKVVEERKRGVGGS